MGFFDNLWDGAVIDKETLKHIRKTAKEISEEIEWLYSSSSDSKLTGTKVDEILTDFKNSASDRAVAIEDLLSDICEKIFEDFIDSIEKLNDKDFCGSTVIPVRKIRSECRMILRGIRGVLEKEINDANSRPVIIPHFSWGREGNLWRIRKILLESITKFKQELIQKIIDRGKSIKEEMKIGLSKIEFHFKNQLLGSLKIFKESIEDMKNNEKNQINVAFDLWKAQYIYQISKEMQNQ